MQSDSPHSGPVDRPPILTTSPSASEIPPGTLCPRCGYDLAGLLPSGRCPECGGANRNALEPYRLVNTSPAYVKRLHVAATFTQIWIAIDMVWSVVLSVLFIQAPMLSILVSYSMVMYAGILLIKFVALWLLSSRDPLNPTFANRDTSRRIFRVFLVADFISSAFIHLCYYVPVFGYFGTPTLIDVVAGIAFVGTFIMSIVYIRSLARKVPNDKLSHRASIILYVSIALLILTYFEDPLTMFAMAYIGRATDIRLGLIVNGVSVAGMYLPYFILLHLIRRELKSIRARM